VSRRGMAPKKSILKKPAQAKATKQKSELAVAIARGVVTKARRPFALFTQEQLKQAAFAGRPWTSCMAEVAARWKAMTAEEQAMYRQRSLEEFDVQRRQALELGLRSRRGCPAVAGGVTLALQQHPDQVRFGHFVMGGAGKLGRGSYGRVVEGRHIQTGQRAALKIFDDDSAEDAKREIAVYRDKIPGLGAAAPFLSMLACREDPPMPWMALPLVQGGVTSALKRDRSPDTVDAMVIQIGKAVFYLHQALVLHLDIKPGNVLWDPFRANAYLIDFGMSEYSDSDGVAITAAHQRYTTAVYRAPELWASKMTPGLLTRAADVWSYGCFVSEVCTGRILMDAGTGHQDEDRHLFKRITAWCQGWPAGPRAWQCSAVLLLPPRWRQLVWWCLAPAAKRRPKVLSEDVRELALDRLPS
jgi:hypothetical protein